MERDRRWCRGRGGSAEGEEAAQRERRMWRGRGGGGEGEEVVEREEFCNEERRQFTNMIG